MFTYNGAWAAHEENERGSLEKGKLADIVMLDADPYDSEKGIKDLKVKMTISD